MWWWSSDTSQNTNPPTPTIRPPRVPGTSAQPAARQRVDVSGRHRPPPRDPTVLRHGRARRSATQPLHGRPRSIRLRSATVSSRCERRPLAPTGGATAYPTIRRSRPRRAHPARRPGRRVWRRVAGCAGRPASRRSCAPRRTPARRPERRLERRWRAHPAERRPAGPAVRCPGGPRPVSGGRRWTPPDGARTVHTDPRAMSAGQPAHRHRECPAGCPPGAVWRRADRSWREGGWSSPVAERMRMVRRSAADRRGGGER